MAPTKKQLTEALRDILPFAEIEIGCLVDYCKSMPDDELADPERARQGEQALANAKAILGGSAIRVRRKHNWSQEDRLKAAERIKGYWAEGKMKRTPK